MQHRSFHLSFDEKAQRPLCSRKPQIYGPELPAPLPARIEIKGHTARISRSEGRGVIFEGRAAAAAPIRSHDHGMCRMVGKQELLDTDFTRVQKTESYGIRASRSQKRIRQGDDPALLSGLRVGCSASYRKHSRQQNDQRAAHKPQSRPRPDFLIRPSAVSDSTILSSTPLMKLLLPGVE